MQFCPHDGARLIIAVVESPLIGKILGDRYRIIRKLGEGGMGEVYEAAHTYIDKKFALKLLRPEITAHPEAVARFHQEARAASSIGHENIVAIDDFGRLPDGSVYLAMELLPGQSLADRLRQAPLSVDEYLAVSIQVVHGLAAAHAKGIVHRDMKPENIFLIEKFGQTVVKILDFGIAKMAGEGQEQLTRTGQIFGTPQYMSPEQALGKPLDDRSDIYSVGVILYEMATGRVPYQAESFMGVLTQHVTSQPMAPREAAPQRDVPPQIEAVILRAMAKERDDRFLSMEEFGSALVEIANELAPTLGDGSEAFRAIVFEQRLSGPMPPLASHPGIRIPAPSPTPRSEPPRTSPPPVPVGSEGLTPPQSLIKWAVGLGLVTLAIAGSAAALLWRDPAPRAPVPPLTAAPVPPLAVAPVPALPTPRPAPAPQSAPPPSLKGAAEVEVLVDSIPNGATLLIDGNTVAFTPEVIKVEEGMRHTVTLRKSGYRERTLVLDPLQERKVIVRLERHGGSSEHSLPPPSLPLPRGPEPPVSPPERFAVPPPPVPTLAPAEPRGPSKVPPRRVVKPARAGEPLDPYE